MKYGIYKSEWSTADVDPFTTIEGHRLGDLSGTNAYTFYNGNGNAVASYPMSHFYVVALED